MAQQRHSEEFKRSAVQKVLLRGGKSIEEVCEEIGIANPTFYEWRRKYANSPGMKKSERRPQDWTPTEKFKAVFEHEALSPDKQGEFLRTQGLHSEHIESWKKAMALGLEPTKKDPAARAEMSELKAKNKELERDLNRKNKALAETTALLILKKKADLLWGTGEEE